MEQQLEWVKDIPGWETRLTEDMNEVRKIIGDDNFLKLWERFMRTGLFFPEQPLNRLRAEYVKKNFTSGDAGKIARTIGTGTSFVFQNAPRNCDESQIKMF